VEWLPFEASGGPFRSLRFVNYKSENNPKTGVVKLELQLVAAQSQQAI
jgi:hypothetical protein